MRNVSTLKRRRGVTRASITQLTSQLRDLESNPGGTATLSLAHGMTQKLDTLDSEFRTHHHALIEEDEETLKEEQSTFDEHNDIVANISVRIQQLIGVCNSSSEAPSRKIASRRLSHLQKSLSSVSLTIASLSGIPDDTCLL